MGVRVRTAVSADRPTLEIVRQQAIEAAYADRYDRDAVADWIATPSDLDTWIDDERFVAVVAETEVTQVGYAVGDRSIGRLEAVYVAPDYEGRGYGTSLVERVAARLRDAGVSVVSVDAPDPVSEFFERQGFEPTGKRSNGAIPRIELEKEFG